MTTRDTMELREATIRAQYEAALGLVQGFDHAPRLARATTPEKLAASVDRLAELAENAS